eukprot:1160605-Pelagomonas_calceolata.AAC.8
MGKAWPEIFWNFLGNVPPKQALSVHEPEGCGVLGLAVCSIQTSFCSRQPYFRETTGDVRMSVYWPPQAGHGISESESKAHAFLLSWCESLASLPTHMHAHAPASDQSLSNAHGLWQTTRTRMYACMRVMPAA